MAGTPARLSGPALLTAVYTTNVFNQASALLLTKITKIHIVNVTAAPVTLRLYLGATGANVLGTEILPLNLSVPANDEWNEYGALILKSTDFLVGGASAANALVITLEGEYLAAF